jgi:hypothetical protein
MEKRARKHISTGKSPRMRSLLNQNTTQWKEYREFGGEVKRTYAAVGICSTFPHKRNAGLKMLY